jgi:hypothetical protein
MVGKPDCIYLKDKFISPWYILLGIVIIMTSRSEILTD